ncbi:MAG TPA: MaoC family dehydratase [Candidatus Cybelea sp.]|nr:MaoC family dehydratase [Candidatus Cybelea sp.]
MSELYFDDFQPGQRFESMGLTVTEGQIIDFALRYDPQPFHMDAEAAKKHQFGGLIASGFQTLSLSFSLFFRLRIIEHANLGSPGMEEVRWLKPLRPGDTIHTVVEVLSVKASQSKPDRGVVTMRHDTINQHGELIMTVNCLHMLKREGI